MGSRRDVLRVASLLAVLLVATPAPAEDESVAYEGAVGLGAGLCSLVYGPLKVAYALGGVVVGSLAWLFTLGDADVAGPIFAKTVGGDYVVSPAHLEGRQELHFTGR